MESLNGDCSFSFLGAREMPWLVSPLRMFNGRLARCREGYRTMTCIERNVEAIDIKRCKTVYSDSYFFMRDKP
jgi:hypothetical protein